MSLNLITTVNNKCPNYQHSHRMATNIEYSRNKLYKLKDTGCYLCNPQITFDKLTPSISWRCAHPIVEKQFVNIISHTLTLSQKAVFISITQQTNSSFYLPLEIILIIFKHASWNEEDRLIKKITPALIDHTSHCNKCAKKLVLFNTMFTCKYHIVPRKKIND